MAGLSLLESALWGKADHQKCLLASCTVLLPHPSLWELRDPHRHSFFPERAPGPALVHPPGSLVAGWRQSHSHVHIGSPTWWDFFPLGLPLPPGKAFSMKLMCVFSYAGVEKVLHYGKCKHLAADPGGLRAVCVHTSPASRLPSFLPLF